VGLLPRELEIACVDPHQTGFIGKGSDHLQLIEFWPSRATGKWSVAGQKSLAWPYYSQRAVFASSLSAFFHFYSCDVKTTLLPCTVVSETLVRSAGVVRLRALHRRGHADHEEHLGLWYHVRTSVFWTHRGCSGAVRSTAFCHRSVCVTHTHIRTYARTLTRVTAIFG